MIAQVRVDLRQLLPQLLLDAGVQIVSGDEKHLVLRLTADDPPRKVSISWHDGRITRSAFQRHRTAAARTILVGTSASSDILELARSGRVDLVSTDPPQVIIGGSELIAPAIDSGQGSMRRVPWVRLAAERLLAVAATPLPQSALATEIGATQQAISRALTLISSTERTSGGYRASDDLLDHWLAEYPGPRGVIRYWYGLDDPMTQAVTAAKYLAELEVVPVASGDIAGDTYAPWQIPATALFYLPELIDFTPVGFGPADAKEATLITIVPEDLTIARTSAEIAGRPWRIADPAITLWDLRNTSVGPNSEEAADRLRAMIEAGRSRD